MKKLQKGSRAEVSSEMYEMEGAKQRGMKNVPRRVGHVSTVVMGTGIWYREARRKSVNDVAS